MKSSGNREKKLDSWQLSVYLSPWRESFLSGPGLWLKVMITENSWQLNKYAHGEQIKFSGKETFP